MESLLSYYTLGSIDTFKVHVELLRFVSAEEPCQARIELKFTPQPTDPSRFQGQLLQAVLSVQGFSQKTREEERIFAAEVGINAIYRPIGTDPGFDVFNRAHTSLTRQLLPLLQRRVVALLSEVGLQHIQLPIDLVHAETEKPTALH
jgi:hypothetical protein